MLPLGSVKLSWPLCLAYKKISGAGCFCSKNLLLGRGKKQSALRYQEQAKYLAPGRCFREAVQGMPAVALCLLPPFLPYSAGIYEASASA